MSRDDLEEALAACWNLDDLAVYADLLLAEDDPRGELIALDLQPDPESDEWAARRFAVIARWLGSDLARRSHHLVKHGFIHALDDGKRSGPLAQTLLESPAGSCVRRFTTRGPSTKVRATIQRLAAKSRPFLTQLEVSVRGTSETSLLSNQLVDRLTAATPRLYELEVRGHRVFDTLAHPALRRLHLSNHDSVVDVVRPRVDEEGFLRVTCEAATGQYAGTVPRDELRHALDAIDKAKSYDKLYAESSEVFGETLPALLARLEQAALVMFQSGTPVLTQVGRGVLAGSHPMPLVRRSLERPLVPITNNRHGNNVWLETKKQIGFIGHIHTLSSLACMWLERLPLTARIRRVVEELLDVLYTLRHHGRTHAQESVSANLELVLRQLSALEIAGIDPKRGEEKSVWAGGWPEVRDGVYREMLRTAATRMTFAVR
ncbi:MAG: hypothetical protein H0V17_29335 [Deltaproteobacteria bacterium]|nr:hypothetical protein [Deltaproteobacteria bacterium]